ncbi:PstS family phosphate ABC transporter substrate-binding protein [Gracilimonas sp.]|uniref:PstS family phosphate ABC transporter substrate-binding protein n=1 Tax=Gracilimonas sp. TaxID=1974203 RepID=UPI003BAB314A
MRIFKTSILAGVFIALSLSCTKTDSVQVGGSTTVLPIVSVAAEEFQALHPEITILVNSGGSGVGINQVGLGQLDIGMTSRAITEKEKERYPDVNFLTHTIGKDAVLAVVSSEIYHAGITALSTKEIQKIYAGKISNWKELGGPDREILVIDKERSRGTRHVFMKIIAGDDEALAPGADLVMGANNELQLAISQSDAAIGMLSFAWQNEQVKGLGIEQANSAVIVPSLDNIRNGSYPIVRDIELVTNGEPTGNSKTFIEYILSEEGQEIIEKAGYVRIK